MDANYFTVNKSQLLVALLVFVMSGAAYSQTYCNANPPGFTECEIINCVLCDLDGFVGSTAGYGTDPDNDLLFLGFCGGNVSVQYVQFYAAVSDMNITVTVSNCTVVSGIDLALMPECDEQVEYCTAGNGTNSTTLSATGLTIGETYILIINVDAIGACDYIISVDPPSGTVPIVSLEGDLMSCPNGISVYQVIPDYVYADYTWTVPNGATMIFLHNHSSIMGVNWGSAGSGTVCVTGTNPCSHETVTLCLDVTLESIPPTVLPPVVICAEEAPFELPWGQTTNISGNFSTILESIDGCDSMVEQMVTILPANFHTIAPIVLCEGECLNLCGMDFCDYGISSVTCQTVNGCDSVIAFSIIPPNLFADIAGNEPITCSNPTVTLISGATQGVKNWYNESGQLVGTGTFLTVNSPGTYTLTVSLTINGMECTKTASVVVALNTAPPGLIATGALIGCDTLPVRLSASTPANPALYTWSGPNGFASNLPNPVVTDTGIYIISVIDLSTGCANADTVLVAPCCHIAPGYMDSIPVSVCGEKSLMATFLGGQYLSNGDTLVFILYSDPADPLGSALMLAGTPLFPFVDTLLHWDSLYFVAALAGPILANHAIDFFSPCFSLSPGQLVRWIPKPTIAVSTPPTGVCSGDCVDITFTFTGTPPFQFHYGITQNGQELFSQMETSANLQKTITVCTPAFSQPPGPGDVNFYVDFLMDARCSCSD